MSDIARAGACAILGASNVGKSTFLNAVMGQKLAITSPVRQTTRNRIRCVLQRGRSQIVLVDTPGLHQHRGRLNRRMMRAALTVLDDVDAVLLVVDASRRRGFLDIEAERALPRLAERQLPCVLALNKIDKLKKPALLPMLEQAAALHPFAAIVPISAQTGDGTDAVLDEIAACLPEGAPLFAEGDFTDQTERQLCAELVREQLLLRLREELPHSVTVTIETFDESQREEPRRLVEIEATIWVEREAQKPIVIGAGGQMIKKIGAAARREIEPLLDAQVMLRLHVAVAQGWTDDPNALERFGLA
jgi:GTP-binding protein Era